MFYALTHLSEHNTQARGAHAAPYPPRARSFKRSTVSRLHAARKTSMAAWSRLVGVNSCSTSTPWAQMSIQRSRRASLLSPDVGPSSGQTWLASMVASSTPRAWHAAISSSVGGSVLRARSDFWRSSSRSAARSASRAASASRSMRSASCRARPRGAIAVGLLLEQSLAPLLRDGLGAAHLGVDLGVGGLEQRGPPLLGHADGLPQARLQQPAQVREHARAQSLRVRS